MRKFFSLVAICITAILVIALCGCEDLGAFADTTEYYNSFGDLVFVDGDTKKTESFSVEGFFYNEESRENFLVGEDGVYHGVPHANYVYVAIPFENEIEMDSLALYIQSLNDVSVYIDVFVAEDVPSNWKPLAGNIGNNVNTTPQTVEDTSGEGSDEKENYDDPSWKTRIGTITVHLKSEKWSSFTLDSFQPDGVDGKVEKSIIIQDGQCVLLQIRNNSGVIILDEENGGQSSPEMKKATITMTNLLVRALAEESDEEVGGE